MTGKSLTQGVEGFLIDSGEVATSLESGKDGADAKPYQEKEVQKAIEEVERNEENE